MIKQRGRGLLPAAMVAAMVAAMAAAGWYYRSTKCLPGHSSPADAAGQLASRRG